MTYRRIIAELSGSPQVVVIDTVITVCEYVGKNIYLVELDVFLSSGQTNFLFLGFTSFPNPKSPSCMSRVR